MPERIVTISQTERKKVLKVREVVDAYREAHALLHQKSYYRGIHDDHTPLLYKLKSDVKSLGFENLEHAFKVIEYEDNLTFLKTIGFDSQIKYDEAKAKYVREGECNRCGICCRLIAPNCEHLLPDGSCAIQDNKPLGCQTYPTIDDYLKGNVPTECSYTFRKVE